MSYYHNVCCGNPYPPQYPCNNYPGYPAIIMKCKKKKKKKKKEESCHTYSDSSDHDNSHSDSSYHDNSHSHSSSLSSCDDMHKYKSIIKKKLKPINCKIEPIWDAVKSNYILKCSRSIAFGYCNTVSGCSNLASGAQNIVCGQNSFHAGSNNKSNGKCNMLLGEGVDAGIHANVFAFSDASGLTTAQLSVGSAAYFGVTNGMTVYTNAARTIGVNIAANGNAWNVVCDEELKTDMVELNPNDVLERLHQCRYYKFKYKGQGDDEQEFMAPTAQQFNSLFPLNKPNEKVINQFDATSSAMAGVSALYSKYLELEERLNLYANLK